MENQECFGKCRCKNLQRYTCKSIERNSTIVNVESLATKQKRSIRAFIARDFIELKEQVWKNVEQVSIFAENVCDDVKQNSRESYGIRKSIIMSSYDELDFFHQERSSKIRQLMLVKRRIEFVGIVLQSKDLDRQNMKCASSIVISMQNELDEKDEEFQVKTMRKSVKRSVAMPSFIDEETPNLRKTSIVNQSEPLPLLENLSLHHEENNRNLFLRRQSCQVLYHASSLTNSPTLPLNSYSRNRSNTVKAENFEYSILAFTKSPNLLIEYNPGLNALKKSELELDLPLKDFPSLATLSNNKLLYIESGMKNMIPFTKRVLIIDVQMKSINELNQPKKIKVCSGIPVYLNDCVYIFGGLCTSAHYYSKKCEKLNISSNSWSSTSKLPCGSILNTTYAVSQFIYLTGYNLQAVYKYDTLNDCYEKEFEEQNLGYNNIKGDVRFLCGSENKVYYFITGKILEGPVWSFFATNTIHKGFMLRNWVKHKGSLYLLLDNEKIYEVKLDTRIIQVVQDVKSII